MTDVLLNIQRRKAELEATVPDELRQKLRCVVRDFFADKPPGTTLAECDLAAYRQRLREVVQEHHRQLAGAAGQEKP